MEGDFQTGSNASIPAECHAIHLSSDTVCLEIVRSQRLWVPFPKSVPHPTTSDAG